MAGSLKPLIILGIDPGTRTTGWGVIAVHGDAPSALACGVISAPGRTALEQRLEHIFSELGDLIARHRPSVMAIEQPFVGANARSAMAVGEARTVALLAATLAGVPVRRYAPAQIKRSVAGYGQGDKRQVREMLRLQMGAELPDSDLNASDALAVALCHAVAARADEVLARASR